MHRIACVHGIAQEYKSRETLLAEWVPALCGGVSIAGGQLAPAQIDMAFYGVMFRPQPGQAMTKGVAITVPDYAPGDLSDPVEIEILSGLYESVASAEPRAPTTKGGVARNVAGMLQTIGRMPFFGSVAQKFVIWYLKQVSAYITDPAVRAAARKAVLDTISPDTRVLIGHSLGSVVAWETLCANPGLHVHSFISVGSPLGMPALLPRLYPPVMSQPGRWPGGVQRWVNIADGRDVVALEKRLARVFGARVEDYLVENGATMHNISPYLTSRELGAAIRTALE